MFIEQIYNQTISFPKLKKHQILRNSLSGKLGKTISVCCTFKSLIHCKRTRCGKSNKILYLAKSFMFSFDRQQVYAYWNYLHLIGNFRQDYKKLEANNLRSR